MRFYRFDLASSPAQIHLITSLIMSLSIALGFE
jgi:hypothetical protein